MQSLYFSTLMLFFAYLKASHVIPRESA